MLDARPRGACSPGATEPCDNEKRMLRYALRRILWAIPTLAATSLVLFFVTTLVPGARTPTGPGDASDPAALARSLEARRSSFADLPRFLNRDPEDVRSRARAAVAEIAAGDANASPQVVARGRRAAHELQHLG